MSMFCSLAKHISQSIWTMSDTNFCVPCNKLNMSLNPVHLDRSHMQIAKILPYYRALLRLPRLKACKAAQESARFYSTMLIHKSGLCSRC